MAIGVVGALRVVLGMDIAEFSEGAKKAGSSLSNLADQFGITEKRMKTAGLLMAAGFAAASAAIVVGMKRAINAADDLSKLSQKIGVPIEQLSSLAYAAQLADVPIEGLATGLKKLSINMQQTASGDTGTAAKAFKALGVSVTEANGALRPSSLVLQDIAEKFSHLQDGAGKTALAVQIFGKQGSELIPLLNMGGAGLAEMTERAEKMGLVLTAETGRAAEEFNDRLEDISMGLRGLWTQISARLLPIVNDMTEAFAQWIRGSGEAKSAGEAIAAGITSIYMAALDSIAAIQRLGIRLQAFWSSAIALFTSTEVSAVQQQAEDAVKKIDADLEARKKRIEEIAAQGAHAPSPGGVPADAKQAPLPENTEKLKEAQRELNKLIQEGVSLVKQTRDPMQIYTDNIKALDAAMAAGKITAAQYGEAQKQAVLVSVNAYAGAVSGIASSLSQVFGKSKAVAIATAMINSFQAATNAMAQVPYPLNIPAAAAALAAGLAQVANIRKTTEGSSGGGSASTAAAAPEQPKMVQGINIALNGDNYSREGLRNLLGSLSGQIRDGAVLTVT